MDSRVRNFFDGIKGKKIAFLGAGVTNIPLARLFLEKGAVVTICDRRSREEIGKEAPELEEKGAVLKLGDGYLDIAGFDMVFRTPGMYFHLPELEEASRRGVVVTSEMEVFFELCPAKTVAVTGSDGKTTTTTIISEMLKAQGFKVHIGGNIGTPLLPIIEEIGPEDVAVAELSSFQLISMRKSPDIAVITNISPNHLDVHKDMDEYIEAKKNIFLHQGADSRLVLNADNEITRSFVGKARGQALLFSRKEKVEWGACLDGNKICAAAGGALHEVMEVDDIFIPGKHNVENYLAAVAALWGIVEPGVMRDVARSFAGVEHRIEFVCEKDGVRWYNDSIATSPTRTIAGLDSFSQKVILIAGGYDKNIPFAPLAPKILEKVKCLILCGATAEKIEAAVRAEEGFSEEKLPIIKVASLEEAVRAAQKVAVAGDVVTLSPACASFDMYPNFEARGRHFKELVKKIC